MIVGTGVDLVAVPRIGRFRERWGSVGLARLFTAGELGYCLALARPLPSLAARFAAKEAFFKASGHGQGKGGAWTDVEVSRATNGRPALKLHGRAATVADRLGVARIHLTLSHTAELATAFVILERGQPDGDEALARS
jgi:holo-[acyl-carrier protein] synthase